jgi:regulator of sirC expression with transglutaminase-like and TPR domain
MTGVERTGSQSCPAPQLEVKKVASIDDLEAEANIPSAQVDAELERLKKVFVDRWGFQYNRGDLAKALDTLLDYVRAHR